MPHEENIPEVEMVIDQEPQGEDQNSGEELRGPQGTPGIPKPRRQTTKNRKVRELDTLMTAPLKGMLPAEKDLVIKTQREELAALKYQSEAFRNAANEAKEQANKMAEYCENLTQRFNKKLRAVTVFTEAINNTIKE